jgi:hypothetical protein
MADEDEDKKSAFEMFSDCMTHIFVPFLCIGIDIAFITAGVFCLAQDADPPGDRVSFAARFYAG